jgi:hypothetical protein
MYHTPFAILPNSTMCLSCFAETLVGQTEQFASVSATTVSLKEPNSEAVSSSSNIFMVFSASFGGGGDRSLSCHFPLGAIILSVFNEARLYYQWQMQSQNNHKSNHFNSQNKNPVETQPTTLHPMYSEASIGLQTYLSFKTFSIVKEAILSKIGLMPRDPTSVIWPWQDIHINPKLRPTPCGRPNSQGVPCKWQQCLSCHKMCLPGNASVFAMVVRLTD